MAKLEAREKLLKAARRREIDVVLVGRLDRWDRSVTDLVATLQELNHLEAGFVSLTEALDLTAPAGRTMTGLLAIFAKFGKRFCRNAHLLGWHTPGRTADAWGGWKRRARHAVEIRKLHRVGISKSGIAKRLQTGPTSVRRILETKS